MEKTRPQINSHVSAVSSTSHSSTSGHVDTPASPAEGHHLQALHWQPGYLSRIPYKGFAGIIGVLLYAIVNIVVLVTSDGVSSSKWPERVAPHTIIGTLLSLSGIFLAAAIGEGVSIAWWRKGRSKLR